MKVIMAEKSDIYHDSRVLKEANSLANAGYDVSVYGLREKWKTDEPKKYNFNITTFPVVSRKYRALRNISIFINIFIIHIIIVLTRAQYYHAHNTMFLLGMYASSRIHGGKFVYDSHEVQWEQTKIASFLEKMFIHKADSIITVREDIACAISKRYSVSKDKFVIVSNFPYLSNPKMDLGRKVNRNNIGMIYSGGYDIATNRLDNLLYVLTEFKQFSLYMLSVGYGKSFYKFRELIDGYGLNERVHFLPLVPPEKIGDVISVYDISVNLETNPKNKIGTRYSSSNKMYGYIAAGLPILCTNIEAYETDFIKNGVAISVGDASVLQIKEALEVIINDPDIIILMRKKAIDLSRRKFYWEAEEKKLIGLYRQLILR